MPYYWLTDVAGEHVMTIDGLWRPINEAREQPIGLLLLDTERDAVALRDLLKCSARHTRVAEAPTDYPGHAAAQ